MKKVFGKGAVSFKLHLPSNCTPKLLPDTPLKAIMFDDIINSLKELLIPQNTTKIYPHHLKVIIANFNVGDPGTYVFIPNTKEVFEISLYDPDDPFSDMYLKFHEFPMREYYDMESDLIPKILKYGRTYWMQMPQ